MKKLFIVLCVVIMFFGVVGCPSSDDQPKTFHETGFTSSTTSDNTTTTVAFTESNDGMTETVDDGGNHGGSPVPEPATLMLLGSGLVGLAGVGRKKFFKKD